MDDDQKQVSGDAKLNEPSGQQQLNASAEVSPASPDVKQTQPKQTITYSDTTNRINALSGFIKAISPFLWLAVILFIVVKFWGTFSIQNLPNKYTSTASNNIPKTEIVRVPDYSQINSDIVAALKNARAIAEKSADEKLSGWINELNERADNDFLNWYFGYFTQLYFGSIGIATDISSLVTHQFNPQAPTAEELKAEKLTEEFQKEFTKRVIQPNIAQLKLERFTRETIETYTSTLSEQLAGIQSKYEIPQGEWEQYLDGVSVTILDSAGNNQNLSLRLLSRGTTYLLAVPLTKATIKLGTKITAKFAEKTAVKMSAKLSTKTAAKVASEFGTSISTLGLELIDPLAAIGILAWDVWDNYHTAQVERPIMQQAIKEYLNEMKLSLIYNSQSSIMSTIYTFEGELVKKLGSFVHSVLNFN